MTPFQFHTTKGLVVEAGAAARLAGIAAGVLAGPVLLITDPGIVRLGLHRAALEDLQRAGLAVTVFSEVEADPSRKTLMAAVAAGKAAEVRSVLGFGGGSSLDVAKLAALLLGSGEDLDQAWGVGQAKGPRLPLVLIPTTAGTGSEVTPVAIITVGEGEKRGVSSPAILPDLAVLDAELTLTLPPAVTAATGVDAMVHAIEAYSSANPNNNPLSRMLAVSALDLLARNIDTAVFQGGNRDARQAMLLGSLLAGQAFANSPVAAVHALAYPLGGLFHIPHGLSNALVLPHVLRFNLPAASGAYAALAATLDPGLAQLPDEATRAAGFVDALVLLSARLGLPPRLRDAGVPETALGQLAADAMKQTRLLVNNPRPVTEADALAIYTAAW